MTSRSDMEEIADGLALWQELKPQSAEDWVAVAERWLEDDAPLHNASPMFEALCLAVKQRNEARNG